MTATLAGETGNPDRPLRLLWLDLETTGSHRREDHPLEISMRLTEPDWPFQPLRSVAEGIDEAYFIRLIQPEGQDWSKRMPVPVLKMHVENGLLAEIVKPIPDEPHLPTTPYVAHPVLLADADRDAVEWLALYDLRPHELVLAGSGVGHFDKGVIDEQFPRLAKWLRYWCFDVGVVRRFLRAAGFANVVERIQTELLPDGKEHRSDDDVLAHLAEARAYGSWIRELATAAGEPLQES